MNCTYILDLKLGGLILISNYPYSTFPVTKKTWRQLGFPSAHSKPALHFTDLMAAESW